MLVHLLQLSPQLRVLPCRLSVGQLQVVHLEVVRYLVSSASVNERENIR